MAIVITGASGLLARYVEKTLVSKDVEYLLLSRSSKAVDNYIETDYSVEELASILKSDQTIVHLAGSRIEHDSVLDYKNEIEILENLLNVAFEKGVKNFVLASSISVYSGAVPFKENDTPRPMSKYGLNKLVLEHISRQFSEANGFPVTVLRLSHLFGANEKNNYMINLFMRRAFLKRKLHVIGSSTKKREFLYAKDAAEVIYRVVEKCLPGFNVLNVPGSEVLTNIEVAKKINMAFENGLLEHSQKEIIDVFPESYMLNRKIKETLGMSPETNFFDAMKEIYQEMKVEPYVPLRY